MKSFEDLMKGVNQEPEDISDYPDISDEEADIRGQVFLNGYRLAEDLHRKEINNISFRLNRKILEGCQGEDLIQFYNERVKALLDDFIF